MGDIVFSVIDLQTGKLANPEEIAMTEAWAKGLIWCDMEGFALEEDGTLLLLDECGYYAYCPPNRFKIVIGSGTSS